MGKFLGLMPSDVFGTTLGEMKVGMLRYTKEQAADLDANGILAEYETSASEAKTATTFLNQPPCPRQITAIVKSTDAGEVTADSTIIINGTNILGKAITETLTFTANLATAKTTAKAFKTITSIVFSAQADGTPAFDVGWNEVIGLPFMFAEKPFVLEKFTGVVQFTAGTLTIDDNEIEKNTYDPNGNLDGTGTLELLFFM